jgi:hypothetical protein
VTVNVEVDDDGIPADRSDEWLDLAGHDVAVDEPAAAIHVDERELAAVS